MAHKQVTPNLGKQLKVIRQVLAKILMLHKQPRESTDGRSGNAYKWFFIKILFG